jgi:hypothetical protein
LNSRRGEQARKVRIDLREIANGVVAAGHSSKKHSRGTSNANRSRKVKKHLCLVCGALAGLTMLHCSALAETAKPNSTAAAPASSSAPLKTNGQRTAVEDCEDEWRAHQEAMMKLDMTEDSYVEQCSVKDDVPAMSSGPKTNAAPAPAPK